jgi:UDP-glucuronate 4-epimerase
VNLLVTGGAGFIGSHLVRALLDRGDQVTVLDSFNDAYDPALKEENLQGLDIQIIHGDVRDRASVEEGMRGVDSVVHLAALAGVRESLEDPAAYASVNVDGTVNLLEALKARDRMPLVFASSSSVYGARTGGPFKETDLVDWPESPYAATKRSAELMCHAAHQSWGQSVSMLRFFTVYGPRQRPTMAISRFVRMALAGETIPLYGDGSSARDYTYVDDVVRAILAAVDQPQGEALLNVGGGNPIRLDALVAAVGQACGVEVQVEHQGEQRGDVPLTWADPSRIQEVLGWSAEVDLVEGLRRVVASMR